MFKKLLIGVVAIYGVSISTFSISEVLCHTCEVRWIDTEKDNGDLIFATTDDIGTGPCAGTYMTSRSGLADRQKDQMMSVLLTALMSGAKITAEGGNSSCDSLSSITIKKL